MRNQRLVLGTQSIYVLGRKLPVRNCHVCFLSLVLGWLLVLVCATVLFSQELLVLAENRGASGLGFQEEPKGGLDRVLTFSFQLLWASLILSPVSQFERSEEGDDSQHKPKHCFNHAGSHLLLGMFQS